MQINSQCFPLKPEYIRIAAWGKWFQMTGESREASRHLTKTAFSARRADAKMSLGVIGPRCGSPSALERRRRRFRLTCRGQRRGALQVEYGTATAFEHVTVFVQDIYPQAIASAIYISQR